MRNLILIAFLALNGILYGQSPVGIWKNLDDTDGKEKSHIEISESGGVLKAKVIKLLAGATIKKCDACKGDKKGKDLVGLDILWGMKESGKIWEGGTILDPKTGKEYNCKIEFDGTEKLKVRGYVGVSLFGRTQTWYKVK
ncbi:MAG: DUF2147 domain-containing protein [Saprospiraceae bacterium]|jgi:uncharacterized protein (DUF2147 family)|nr:DUF2147 domain-containing protein [Saprospiraceae bacterium]